MRFAWTCCRAATPTSLPPSSPCPCFQRGKTCTPPMPPRRRAPPPASPWTRQPPRSWRQPSALLGCCCCRRRGNCTVWSAPGIVLFVGCCWHLSLLLVSTACSHVRTHKPLIRDQPSVYAGFPTTLEKDLQRMWGTNDHRVQALVRYRYERKKLLSAAESLLAVYAGRKTLV